MKKIIMTTALALVALTASANASDSPDLSNTKITCAGDNISFTINVMNSVNEDVYAPQYLAHVTFDGDTKTAVILDQNVIRTRCEVGWSMSFAGGKYTHFSYRNIVYHGCGTTGVYAELTRGDATTTLQCSITSP